MRRGLPQIKHKSDFASAQELVELGYPAIAPVLPHILEWIQDMNWPVAPVIAPLLASVGSPLVPEFRRVFATNDGTWKYWCLRLVQDMDEAVVAELRPDLTRMAEQPTMDEKYEEVDELAGELLQRL